jgi:hypothetical protein
VARPHPAQTRALHRYLRWRNADAVAAQRKETCPHPLRRTPPHHTSLTARPGERKRSLDSSAVGHPCRAGKWWNRVSRWRGRGADDVCDAPAWDLEDVAQHLFAVAHMDTGCHGDAPQAGRDGAKERWPGRRSEPRQTQVGRWGRGAVAVVMTYMPALDRAAALRPLRRIVTALRMRAHLLMEDLRQLDRRTRWVPRPSGDRAHHDQPGGRSRGMPRQPSGSSGVVCWP